MNKKDLMALGLTEEQAEQAVIMHGRDIESLKQMNVEAGQQVTTYQQQLAEANAQITAFQGMKKPEEVEAAVSEWRQRAEELEQKAATDLYALQFEHQLEMELVAAGARNPVTVEALLDYEKLDLNADGLIEGLEEQLKKVQEENPFLFEEDEDTPQIVTGGQSQSVIGDAAYDAARKAAGLPTTKQGD